MTNITTLLYSFEVVNINLQNKPEWFLNLNPQGTVPTVQYNDKIIYNSLVASEWIDNTFEGIRKLIPSDPYEKAKQKMLLDRLSKVLYTSQIAKKKPRAMFEIILAHR